MIRHLLLALVAVVLLSADYAGAFPKPSPYPVAWQLTFTSIKPQRIVITPPGATTPQAYWYIPYSVINNSRDEQEFLPVFEMMTQDGKVIRSDKDIPDSVLAEIRVREKNPDLLSALKAAGTLRVGIDQAKMAVAVWKEPQVMMGQFKIFVGGLSGENVVLTDENGKTVENTDANGKKAPAVVRKTLQLTYKLLGDELYPGVDPIEKIAEEWVMR